MLYRKMRHPWCNFALTLDLQRQTETEIEMVNLQ